MRKKLGIIVSIGMAVALAGCGATTTIWTKSGVSMTQAGSDLKACADASGFYYDAAGYQGGPSAMSSQATYERSDFDKCMQGKGYKKQ